MAFVRRHALEARTHGTGRSRSAASAVGRYLAFRAAARRTILSRRSAS